MTSGCRVMHPEQQWNPRRPDDLTEEGLRPRHMTDNSVETCFPQYSVKTLARAYDGQWSTEARHTDKTGRDSSRTEFCGWPSVEAEREFGLHPQT